MPRATARVKASAVGLWRRRPVPRLSWVGLALGATLVATAVGTASAGREPLPTSVVETDVDVSAATSLAYSAADRSFVMLADDASVAVKPDGRAPDRPTRELSPGSPAAFVPGSNALLTVDGSTLMMDGRPLAAGTWLDVAADDANAYLLRPGAIDVIDLKTSAATELGIDDLTQPTDVAVSTVDGSLYILSDEGRRLTRVREGTREDLAVDESVMLDIAVAPTADPTDSPEAESLFALVQRPGGTTGLTEITLVEEPRAVAAALNDPVSTARVTNTWQWTPPSPDPSGIAYMPASNGLIISDGEVNEIPTLFTGDNLFVSSLSGGLLDTASTLSYSNEPTGAAVDSAGHLYISDDTGDRGVYEVDPGPDGTLHTGDDSVNFIVMETFGSTDPEGVAFDTTRGNLIVVDGVGEEVYTIDPGPNGVFDGVAPAGDDAASSFDTTALGIRDPEGVEYNHDNDHLYVLSSADDLIAETLIDGTLVRYIDLTGHGMVNPAGLAYAPSSFNSAQMHLYVVDRAVDNNNDPNENDGVMYEVSFEVNSPPAVDAGPDQTASLGQTVALDGTVIDDGLPAGTLTTSWSVVSGPGNVSFGDSGAVDTTADFDASGLYVLRLTADDGGSVSFDEMSVSVAGTGGELSLAVRVSTASDDAEERPNGSITTNSSDLEMVADAGGAQTVGMRFAGLNIPQGATVLQADIQFTVDETPSQATSLTIAAEDVDDATTFVNTANGISSRPRTGATIVWNPPGWPVVGASGPAQATPNLAALVQEVVDRPGWASGNAMAFIVTGSGERVAESYNGDPSAAPLLRITYSTTTPPTVDAGVDQTITVGDPAILDGTV
ncbi:MAG: hypothetical protein OEW30_18410, partial [Acidimicrobiia bacterium]|nr:hypothetical protein [Acidimicrobiia bacterium]